MSRRAPAAQAGQTLVGMMIGLLLSLLTIAAMLALYKAMINVSTDASRTAERGGQLGAAMVAAELELQQAGFGIDPAEAGTNLSVTDTQVVWRYREPGETDTRCAGLRLVTTDANRGLFLLPSTPCTHADDAALTWSASATGQPLPSPLVSDAAFCTPGVDCEPGMFVLAEAKFVPEPAEACFPYELSASGGDAPVVSLVAGSGKLLRACLSNLAVATAPATSS